MDEEFVRMKINSAIWMLNQTVDFVEFLVKHQDSDNKTILAILREIIKSLEEANETQHI